MQIAKKIIEIKNLHYAYPDGTVALKNVSMDIFEKESLGVIGPNGAGKSTLLLHLNGILRGDNHIKILDYGVSEKTLPLIRKNVGLVFQDPDSQLFMPTVFDDVAFGPLNMGLEGAQVSKAVNDALLAVDMLDCARRPSHHLSLGQKKRVSLATVLSMTPKILVLDEPLSDLDPKHRRNLIDILKHLEITKVIATHDLDLVLEICQRAVLLDGGELIACADTQNILKDKVLLEAHSLGIPSSLCRT
jgi:cobalt/nickel transport system ATP-binding protein